MVNKSVNFAGSSAYISDVVWLEYDIKDRLNYYPPHISNNPLLSTFYCVCWGGSIRVDGFDARRLVSRVK